MRLGAPNYGIVSARLWRFADISHRMDFLMAGLGWCRMPEHLVAEPIRAGRLKVLDVEDDTPPREGLTIYAAHLRDRTLGPAGRWVLDDLRRRLGA